MMMLKKNIPNFISLLNLLSGILACIFILQGDFTVGFFFVCLGIFFDFFDGFAARLFNVSSALGIQLDSLADATTSGLAPALAMFQLLRSENGIDHSFPIIDASTPWFAYIGLLIGLGAAYRLAKFNVDTRQTDSFIGLPTPANALFILSIPMIMMYQFDTWLVAVLNQTWVLVGISILSIVAMNAKLSLFSLKIKSLRIEDNWLVVLFLFVCTSLLLWFKFIGLFFIIPLYIIISILKPKERI